MSKYQVIIEDGFSSAHALRHYYGKTEPLHGHNYRVRLVVEGKSLQKKVKYLTDFMALRQILRAIIKPLDYGNLNDIKPFNTENPSAENLARYIGDEVKKRWTEKGVKLESVTVWETAETAARFFP